MTTGRPAVIGIGNPLRGDDGVGPAVLNLLRASPSARTGPVDLVAIDGESTALLEAWAGRPLAVVVDAARGGGGPPGTIHRLDMGVTESGRDGQPAPGPPPALPSASTHGIGVAEAIDLARVLDRLPDRLVVLAVEARDLEPGCGLSAPVAAALPDLAARIRAELAGPVATSG